MTTVITEQFECDGGEVNPYRCEVSVRKTTERDEEWLIGMGWEVSITKDKHFCPSCAKELGYQTTTTGGK